MVKLLSFLTCLTIINAYDFDYKYTCNIDNDSRHNLEGLETLAEKDVFMVTIEGCSGVITDKTFKGFPELGILKIVYSNIKGINATLRIHELWVEESNFPNLDKKLRKKMPRIGTLLLLDNKDFQVDPRIFKKYKKLTGLFLRNTNFTEDCITKEWFQGLDLLEELSLTESNLTCISKHAFNSLKNLQQLNLSYNRGNKTNFNEDCLTKEWFQGLDLLQELKLSGSKVTCISKDAFNSLKNLERLDLSYNRISNFERETFAKLTKLNFLSISVNDIENLDLNTFANQKNSLTQLEISWNALKQSKISAEKILEAFPKLTLLIIENPEVRNRVKALEFCEPVTQNGPKCWVTGAY